MNDNKSTGPELSLGWCEFADAIANGYHSLDNEGTMRCSGCGTNIDHHEPHAQNCIVLRARAALDGEINSAHQVDVKAIHAAVLAVRVDPNASKEKQHAFNAGLHSAAAAVSRFEVLKPIEKEAFEPVSESKEPQALLSDESSPIVDEDGLPTVVRAFGKQSMQSNSALHEFNRRMGPETLQSRIPLRNFRLREVAGEIQAADVNSERPSADALSSALDMPDFWKLIRNYHAAQDVTPRHAAATELIDHITNLCANNFKLAPAESWMTIGDLPPLPHAWRKVYERPHGLQELYYYTADQMQTYAMLAIKFAHAPINEIRSA